MSEPGQKSVEGGNRRNFGSLLMMGMAATGLIGTGIDQAFFGGNMSEMLLRAGTDADFRKKLFDTIADGRAPRKLKEELYENTIPYIKEAGLGEKKDYRESDLDKGFRSYEVRPLVESNIATEKLVLVASLKNNVGVVVTEKTKGNATNYTSTQEKNGDFYSIPSANLGRGMDGQVGLDMYSEFQTENEIVKYSEEMIDYASGALVLSNDHGLSVVDRRDIIDYQVGENCLAIQSHPLVVNSDTLDHDLNSIADAQYKFNGYNLQSRAFECLIATLSDKDGRSETVAISVYEHCNENSGQADGGEVWKNGLSVEHGVGIAKQLVEERGYDKFVLLMPDPHYMHSRMNGPRMFEERLKKKVAYRAFAKDAEPVIDEELDNNPFYPPIFLAVMLGK